MELSEQEAHCVARLLQGAFFGESFFDGCNYCKFQCALKDDGTKADWRRIVGNKGDVDLTRFKSLKKRLTDETGVDLSSFTYGKLPHSEFPYKQFLVNANDEIKEYYRERFNWICDTPL